MSRLIWFMQHISCAFSNGKKGIIFSGVEDCMICSRSFNEHFLTGVSLADMSSESFPNKELMLKSRTPGNLMRSSLIPLMPSCWIVELKWPICERSSWDQNNNRKRFKSMEYSWDDYLETLFPVAKRNSTIFWWSQIFGNNDFFCFKAGVSDI